MEQAPQEAPATRQRRLPKYVRAPHRFRSFAMTEGDVQILKIVHEFRNVRAEHVEFLTGRSRRRLATRLQPLYHLKYLDRWIPPGKMRLLRSGSERMIYGLDRKGAEVLARIYECRIAERLGRMIETIGSLEPGRLKGLNRFWFCLLDDYDLENPEALISRAIWRVPRGGLRTLFPLAPGN